MKKVFTERLPSFLKCPICRNYFNECVSTPCKHKFCKSCIQKTLMCSICSTEIDSINSCCEDVWLNQQIQELHVLCARKECDWKGPLKRLNTHLYEECDYNSIECDFVDCKYVTLKGKMNEHQKNCQYRSILCGHCDFKIKSHQMQSHLLNECLNYPIPCEFCKEKLTRKHFQTHHQNDCPMVEISCPFGCLQKV
jgi:TNF receptor-associated factor 4